MKSKEQKRIEAEVRQDEYNSLQLWERELQAVGRPGNSTKELSRIRASMDK